MAQTETLIPVDSKYLTGWKQGLVHGDKAKISAEFEINRIDITNAFKGFATPTVIRIINRYYGIKKIE